MFLVQMWKEWLRAGRGRPIGSLIRMWELRLRGRLASCRGSEQAQDRTEDVLGPLFQKSIFSALTASLVCLWATALGSGANSDPVQSLEALPGLVETDAETKIQVMNASQQISATD